jgi:ADP-ribose pyrophosphatase YjhB (NUDIX family)
VSVLDVWRFCPRCSEEVVLGEGRAQCRWCGFVAYANSAPTANALVTDEHGRVLLARRAVEPDKGLWDIPGGFLEEGEHPLDAIRRELREETGLEVEPEAFFCATIDRYGDRPGAATTLNLTWTARVVAGMPEPADDVDELRWFAPDELPPPGRMAFTSTAEVLRAWREQHA